MKFFVFVLLFISPVLVTAQQDTSAVLKALQTLETGLVAKDLIAVEKHLGKHAAYGHSNGWVQSKDDVLKDLKSGYLVYQKITQLSISIQLQDKKNALVKEKIAVEGNVNGTNFAMNLFVLQWWKKSGGVWKLVMRQSAKM